MDAVTNTVAISCALVVALCAWKIINILWVRPKKLEKLLRNQGFKGNKYKFLFGDMKEFAMSFQQSRTKHIDIDDEDGVLPYVMTFNHQHLRKFGRSYITWIGWNPRVIIMDPEIIKDVFRNIYDFQKLRLNPLLVKYLATGLVSHEGDQWAKHRKLINPGFHAEKLKDMAPAFHVSCSQMIEKWEKLISSNGSCELDVWPYIQALTSDVISRTTFGSSYEEGVRICELLREQSELVMETLKSLYIPGSKFLPTKRNMRMNTINNEVQSSLRSIIDNRLKAMKAGEGNYEDLLGVLLESNVKAVEQHQTKSHGMTINEVIEECKLFHFAGQDTTSSLIVWTMILLSKHQEWQSRAREEVFNFFGDQNMVIDGLNHLKVVNMILYEVLRLYPPFVEMNRQVAKDITLGGFSLPSGIEIALPIILLHYDEQLWGSDANKFRPERFSEGISKATKNQVIYSPFGWGPRFCIGQNFALQEAKIALVLILQKFSFELSQSYVHAPNVVLTLQPQNGAHLILRKL